jgi:hypothetical protein
MKNYYVMHSDRKGYFVLPAAKVASSWADKVQGFDTLKEAENYAYYANYGGSDSQ